MSSNHGSVTRHRLVNVVAILEEPDSSIFKAEEEDPSLKGLYAAARMLCAYLNPFHSPQQNLATLLAIRVTVLAEQAVGYSFSHEMPVTLYTVRSVRHRAQRN
jgi:hypothetical protein